jgi:Sigma-70 region 2
MSPRLSDLLLRSQSDERLVGLARAGQRRAFAAIVQRYRPELLALAHRLTSDGRAEDLIQQAFLSAFAALMSGAEVQHLRGWLYQIVRNAATKAKPPAELALDQVDIAGEPLEETVLRRARALAAMSELARLPERQRGALVATGPRRPSSRGGRALDGDLRATREATRSSREGHTARCGHGDNPLAVGEMAGDGPARGGWTGDRGQRRGRLELRCGGEARGAVRRDRRAGNRCRGRTAAPGAPRGRGPVGVDPLAARIRPRGCPKPARWFGRGGSGAAGLAEGVCDPNQREKQAERTGRAVSRNRRVQAHRRHEHERRRRRRRGPHCGAARRRLRAREIRHWIVGRPTRVRRYLIRRRRISRSRRPDSKRIECARWK